MTYVAAQNPIWIIRDGEFTEIKPEKMPVSKHDNDHISFSGGEYEIQKGDQIYTLPDGFQDQFGGPKGKKFKYKPFKRLLTESSELSMSEQRNNIEASLDEWMNWEGVKHEQIDDITVIGMRI